LLLCTPFETKGLPLSLRVQRQKQLFHPTDSPDRDRL